LKQCRLASADWIDDWRLPIAVPIVDWRFHCRLPIADWPNRKLALSIGNRAIANPIVNRAIANPIVNRAIVNPIVNRAIADVFNRQSAVGNRQWLPEVERLRDVVGDDVVCLGEIGDRA
jgi:hypothetical protein